MVTKRKSEFEKARGDTRRGIGRMVAALPAWARVNWRDVVMPWRRLPAPVALALIALVALAMVLDTGDNANVSAEGSGVMVGGDTVAPGTRCAEDEVITYRILMGGQGVGCVHYEYVVMDFISTCLIGNSDHGENLASLHLRDLSFRSWCDGVVDNASDGVVSIADMLIDTSGEPVPTVTPTMTATPIMGVATPSHAALPMALPSAGSR